MDILGPRQPPGLESPRASIKPWKRTDGTVILRKSFRAPLKLNLFRVVVPGSPENNFRFVLVVGVPMHGLWLPPWRAIYCEGGLRKLVDHEISDERLFLGSKGEKNENEEDLMTDEEKEILFYAYIFQQSSDDTGRVRQDLLPERATVRVTKKSEEGLYEHDGFLHVSILKPEKKVTIFAIKANQLIILTCEREGREEEVPAEPRRMILEDKDQN